jgi:hypothetical protein
MESSIKFREPVRFTPEVEEFDESETQTIRELNETFDQILQTTSENYDHAVRAVHAKAHAVFEGTFTIEANLPPEYAQGLFASPGEHELLLRMSTNAGDILPDTIGLPRGLAIKVLDVDGERLPGAEGRTQDFVMVNGSSFNAERADQFLKNLKLLAKTTDRGTGAKIMFSKMLQGVNTALEAVGVESTMVQQLGGAPNVDPLGETYFSVTPFRFGDYIAKFSIAPVSRDLTALTGTSAEIFDERPDAIRETVQHESGDIKGEWEFRVQLCRNLDDQPVEDPRVEWDEKISPFFRVATIRTLPQDSWESERVRRIDEGSRFSIWTGLAAHRPLGSINRARNETYQHSARFRERFNRCPIHEPG